ncbi:Uncharacterized conserved protein, DUF952 family [Amycolatopsis xylanica]|uniref:Uncharacterized conserved protein, DUF952 family n=1 Tax=Amycolatopsis xylanica TaxID=589385 RepID=A0A1H3B5X0_9PSEU|nr:DUF952 domain-containing protein [Amycolatopsis xylanica]SDX37313.1 Uncharacterized conserved protein, DUF952 family [Amycolatopsis xylanica]
MILHICTAAEWAAVSDGGSYRAASLEDAGFIHCSDFGTLHLPANALFAGQSGLVLLEIDPAKLDVPLRWEPGVPEQPDGVWFPHVYGPIPQVAVLAVHDFPADGDGRFRLPVTLARR